MSGWVKLHRSLLDWEWYDDHNTTRLFLHLLIKANHAPTKWKGQTIKRGQLVTGRIALAAQTGIPEQTVRTCLERLKSTSELTSKSTNKYTLVTLVNYDYYQSEIQNQPANQPANQPTTNQQLTTSKECKECKEVKDTVRHAPPTLPEVVQYFTEKQYSEEEAKKFFNYYEARGWTVTKNNTPMQKWKAAASNWMTKAQPNNKKLIESIVSSFTNIFPDLEKVAMINGKETNLINKTLKISDKAKEPDWWDNYFKFMSQHPMVKNGFNDWKPSLQWLVNPDTIIKYSREQ